MKKPLKVGDVVQLEECGDWTGPMVVYKLVGPDAFRSIGAKGQKGFSPTWSHFVRRYRGKRPKWADEMMRKAQAKERGRR